MDDEDIKIKQFITKDKHISNKANNTFDDFIEKIQNDEIEQNEHTLNQYQKNRISIYNSNINN